ncbi:MAG: shikimate dehydrogenase [Chloroflexota bacterium]
MTRRLGIFGYPLTHSLSPALQSAAMEECGIDGVFEAWPVPPEEYADEMKRKFGEDGCLGASVTLPHKQATVQLMEKLDETAEEIGAVNTIVKADGQPLAGHNTDAPGFLRALREQAGFDPAGKSALVFGAGGAARAVVHALREAGVSRLSISNRTVERAQALAADMARGRFKPEALGAGLEELTDVAPYADLLVNTTSLGMEGGPAPGSTPVPSSVISGDACCYDAVYVPSVTPFMTAAEEAGARVEGGLSMLIYQAAEQFRLWHGIEAPISVMFSAAERALRERGRSK